jgi:hypothetical protein
MHLTTFQRIQIGFILKAVTKTMSNVLPVKASQHHLRVRMTVHLRHPKPFYGQILAKSKGDGNHDSIRSRAPWTLVQGSADPQNRWQARGWVGSGKAWVGVTIYHLYYPTIMP